MANMTPLSQLRSSMCEFHLMDGRIIKEECFPGGWRDFPFKKFVNGISLAGRFVSSLEANETLNHLAGFAVHWVGMLALNSGQSRDAFREIMLVKKTGRVHVCSYNLCSGDWSDYEDDLLDPARPHLANYDLGVHGIIL